MRRVSSCIDDLIDCLDCCFGRGICVSARSSKLPVGERCVPVGEQSSQGVRLRTGTFPFANGLVCEKNSFLFTLPTLSRGFHRYPVITNGQVPVDERDSTQWQTEEY